MNEFCFVDSPIGVLELEAESDFLSRIKFKEGSSPLLCKESKQNGKSPILVKASKQIDEYFNGKGEITSIDPWIPYVDIETNQTTTNKMMNAALEEIVPLTSLSEILVSCPRESI